MHMAKRRWFTIISFWLFLFFYSWFLSFNWYLFGFPPKGKLNSLVRTANCGNKVDITAFHYYPPHCMWVQWLLCNYIWLAVSCCLNQKVYLANIFSSSLMPHWGLNDTADDIWLSLFYNNINIWICSTSHFLIWMLLKLLTSIEVVGLSPGKPQCSSSRQSWWKC